jgi:hypothetical protein
MPSEIDPALPQPPQPVPSRLPENVRHLRISNNQAVVGLKNGTEEKYDLNKPEDKAAFEKKYGEMPVPPPPTPVPSGD